MTMSWERGRQLSSLQIANNSVSYKYDSNGMRTQKTDNSGTTYYYYDSDKNLIGLTKDNNTLLFYYDSDGNVTSFKHNGTIYYYIKNLQGDIVKIVNQDGTTVVTYTYDSLGKIVDSTDTTTFSIGSINPFRYRGYVYDSETGLYYLKSRYYDPETGRFINADIYCDTMTSIFGTNMFTYCNNNPVNQVDPEGTDAMWIQFGNAVGGAGHTSLLVQDGSNVWWYFYWGPTQAILRPCGKDDFSMAELNSYLTGFDPRPHHNYYVYATNVIDDREDINYSAGSDYYLKCHDLWITELIELNGNFKYSFEYAKDLLERLYIYTDATQLCETIYENGKKYTMYHVCSKVNAESYDKSFLWWSCGVGIPAGYYYKTIEKTNDKAPIYNGSSRNCVQVSMKTLLQGSFSEKHSKYKDKINKIYKSKLGFWPNNALSCLIE